RQTLSVRRSNGSSRPTAALHKVLQVSWRGDRQRPLFSNGELPGQSFRYCHVLQLHIVGQAILERWIVFTNDERRQIPASRLGDAAAVDAAEVLGQQLLLIGDLREQRLDDVPPIGHI